MKSSKLSKSYFKDVLLSIISIGFYAYLYIKFEKYLIMLIILSFFALIYGIVSLNRGIKSKKNDTNNKDTNYTIDNYLYGNAENLQTGYNIEKSIASLVYSDFIETKTDYGSLFTKTTDDTIIEVAFCYNSNIKKNRNSDIFSDINNMEIINKINYVINYTEANTENRNTNGTYNFCTENFYYREMYYSDDTKNLEKFKYVKPVNILRDEVESLDDVLYLGYLFYED